MRHRSQSVDLSQETIEDFRNQPSIRPPHQTQSVDARTSCFTSESNMYDTLRIGIIIISDEVRRLNTTNLQFQAWTYPVVQQSKIIHRKQLRETSRQRQRDRDSERQTETEKKKKEKDGETEGQTGYRDKEKKRWMEKQTDTKTDTKRDSQR